MQGGADALIPIMLFLGLVVPFTTGWVLGCTHNLPVHSLMFLTNLDQARASSCVAFRASRSMRSCALPQGIRVHYHHKRKSEMCENLRCCAGKPGRIPGTGLLAPWVDGCARFCGFMPRNSSHFMLDPFPMQVMYSQSHSAVKIADMLNCARRKRCATCSVSTMPRTSKCPSPGKR